LFYLYCKFVKTISNFWWCDISSDWFYVHRPSAFKWSCDLCIFCRRTMFLQ